MPLLEDPPTPPTPPTEEGRDGRTALVPVGLEAASDADLPHVRFDH